MKVIKSFSVFMLCIVCFGCATKVENLSYVDVKGNPEVVKKMIIQVVDLIQTEKDIETTTIRLLRKGNTVFDLAILDELKTRGFALSDTEGTQTNFLIDSFEKNKIYITVSLDRTVLSRIFIYEAQTGMIRPGSPLSKGEV